MALSSNQYALKVQKLDKISAHKAAPKLPEWPRYGNFRQVTQTRIFSKRAKGGPREIFQKSLKKQPSLKKPISSLAQVALSSIQYALNVQKMEMILAQTTAPKVPGWPSDGNFLQGNPKSAFSKKVQRKDQEIFFQKSPKTQPSLKRPISTLAPMASSFNQNALKVQKLETILAQTPAPKVPEWLSYNSFCKVTQNPYFLKKCKGGTKENFSKIAQKEALV